MKEVRLRDFFSDDCPITWCRYNTYGRCECGSLHFTTRVLEAVADNYGTREGSFDCIDFETTEMVCEVCGRALSIGEEKIFSECVQRVNYCPYCD